MREEDDDEPVVTVPDELLEIEHKNRLIASSSVIADYSYEDLKDFKETLERKKDDIEIKEKELIEKEKTVSKMVHASKKMSSELETYKIEKDLLIQEKKALQEEYEKIKSMCSQLKVEKDEYDKKLRWLENLLEARAENFDVVQRREEEVKKLRETVARLHSENENMRFKYSDYDRLVKELL